MKNFPHTKIQEKLEIFGLICIFIVILFCAYILSDSPISVISALCGIVYTYIAGKGRIICYFFGLCGSGCYAYLALKNGLYGNFLLYLGFYVPMQIIGILKWRKHLNKITKTIIKTRLAESERLFICYIAVCLSAVIIYILLLLKGSNPLFDGITLTLSVIGMYLTIRRAVEQWIVWMIVNFLSICMWVRLMLCGEKICSTVIMWGVYLFLAVYFYINWIKELKQCSQCIKR